MWWLAEWDDRWPGWGADSCSAGHREAGDRTGDYRELGTRHNLCDNMKNRCTTAKYCVETSFWLRGANTFHIFASHRSVVAYSLCWGQRSQKIAFYVTYKLLTFCFEVLCFLFLTWLAFYSSKGKLSVQKTIVFLSSNCMISFLFNKSPALLSKNV